jgi:hypothetical protein
MQDGPEHPDEPLNGPREGAERAAGRHGRLEGVIAVIVYGAGLGDRLRLIEALAADLAAGEACAIMLTSARLPGASGRTLHLPPAATVHEGGGGCPCCIGRVAFQVTLARVLRQTQPRRLLIELADAKHLRRVVAALSEDRLPGVVRLAGMLQAQPSEGPPLPAAAIGAPA